MDRPLPLLVLYPLIFVAVYVTHWRLLRLPYFWDEAGYYIPAAMDFFRTGALVPHSTLTNAHPPLPSILLAGWWKLGGYAGSYVPSGTRTLVVMMAAAALLGVFRLARVLAGPVVATVVAVLTGLYPVWFAQSSLAHADVFAAAFTVWGLSFYFEKLVGGRGRPVVVAVLFSLAALSKETAIVTPVGLGLWELVLAATEKDGRGARLGWVMVCFAPVLPLLGWYGYHWHATGFVFGNPEFLRYNATANLTAGRVAASVWHRVGHLTVHMNLYVPVVATIAALLMVRERKGPAVLERPVLLALGVVVVANALAFSVLGGALLTRYLLPVYPVELLVCVAVWWSRGGRLVWGLGGLTAVAFVAGLFVNPPYSIAPEDNLTYVDFVRLQQQAIGVVAARYPQATVLSAWPATAEMLHPELGYVGVPLKTVAIDNFSGEQVAKAAAEPGEYDVALVFSTKWVPPGGGMWMGGKRDAARYFDFHADLQPVEVARRLGGTVVWVGRRNGEWAAVLHFERAAVAGAGRVGQPLIASR